MQNHSRTNLSVFILYTSILIHGCGCFYSTIRRMDLVKVGPRLESGAVVAEIPVILNNSRTPPSQLNFTLTGDYCFTVDNQGIVSVVGTCLPKMDRGSQVPRQFQVKASLPHFSVPVIVAANLTIVNASCEPSPEKCFAGSLSFQVHQDARGVTHEVPLGRIGQRGSGCKLEAEYSLDPGETVVKLRKDVLWVRTSDLADDFNVTVKCSIGGVSFVRTFTVDVLPRTPWQISSKEAVRLIPSNDVEKGDSFIVSWGFFKEGSRADLVQTTKTSLYSLRMDKHFISSYVANKTLFIITLEWSLCCPNMSLPMVVDANLQVSEPGFPKQEVLLRTVLQTSNFRASLPKLTYPPRMEIYPGLSSLARLAYPNRTRDFATILSNVTFTSVLPSDLTSPFAVTSKAGIVYLDVHRDQQYLYYNFTGELIEWRVNDSTLLQVSWLPAVWNLTSPKGPSCSASQPGDDTFSNDFRYELQCSVKETKKECQSTCGLGASTSKEGFCTWITPSKPLKYSNSTKKPFKISYTTCSTDKFFCPDGICDPLEQLGEFRNIQICPQDCTDEILFSPNTDGPNRKGIDQSSRGLCTCNQLGSCHCSKTTTNDLPPPFKDNQPKKNPRQELQKDDSGLKSTCDGSCLVVLLTVGTGVTLALVLTSAYFCKNSRSACGNQHKSEMNYNSTYGTEALILTDVTVIEQHHQIEIDERWEIPRCCLTVEECLGEGEFGRVLKGTALNLNNHPGYTTVAVKTLKDNAGSAELNDLLSEYQLLKKVDHNNVIKLLGACVTPGGPVYIIIEYCSLGSLRAYLRLHRNLKTNADMGAQLPENSSMITPKDVLSFAYQISKGMAYLADIKLVHRDLAARNVLIAEGKICKVSDFGLTRDVYEDDTYLKQSRGRVPVKWMAIESLADHIYTSQSDVWSFGIVLWELVTLGASPYPGVTIQNLYHLLKNGYRMHKPLNCTTELYEVMRDCWCELPDDRPTFLNLVDKFGRMLERGLDYVNFSIQMISNPSYFNPRDIQDDDHSEMNITFKMELNAIQENNNRYENYSVGPDTSYDTPRPTASQQVLSSANMADQALAQCA